MLFEVARHSIEAAVKGLHSTTLGKIPETLKQPSGAFVTLRIDGDLRGCIGYVDPVNSLYETVSEAAVKAAVEDFRFNPVHVDEIADLEIEISILSPLQKINSISEIEIGTHGLVVEVGNYRGLLLPQVAIEHGWDRETFISQATRKAGLPETMWKHSEANVYTFTANIIRQDAPTHHEH